jgi:Type VI secretion system (T6SS), amidase effector protein 4
MGTIPKRALPLFQSLLGKYPKDLRPCDQNWDNQCAIRVSIALVDAGFALTGYTDPLCKHGHARGAESLATFLWRQVGKPTISKNSSDGKACTRAKTGIILFRDITGFRAGRGDHIDLWDKNATMTGEYFDASKETWFWEIA